MIGIGIDIGGTFVKLYVMNEQGEILRRERFETQAIQTTQAFITQIGDFVNHLKTEFTNQPLAVAVGAPGDVNPQEGMVRYTPNLKFTNGQGWPLAEQLHRYTGLRPCVANDANLAAWGVYELELKRQAKNVLVVTLGTGVGGGLIINQELYQGSHGTAGEIGHTKIADTRTGPLCGCGARGCLEAFVGTIGIKRLALQKKAEYPDSILANILAKNHDFKVEQVAQAAQQGCPQALALWKEIGYYLGTGITNWVLVLDVDTVVLTGGVSGAYPYFKNSLREVLTQQSIQTPFKKLKIELSETPDIGAVGAALYALHRAQPNT